MTDPRALTDWEGGVIDAAPPDVPATPWMLTFADLVSLMLTFFVLMFALSGVKAEPFRALAASLSFALHAPLAPAAETPSAIQNIDRVEIRPGDELPYLAGLLGNVIAETPALKGATLKLYDDRLELVLPPQAMFGGEGPGVAVSAKPAIAALSQAVGGIGNRVTVAVRAADWTLALARAGALANALRAAGLDRSLRVNGTVDTVPGVALVLATDRGGRS
jgi:chemotaxis protein MotB